MNTTQKLIKYLAIALAVAIIVAIVSSVAGIFSVVGGVFAIGKGISNAVTEEKLTIIDIGSKAFELDIDIISAELKIVIGDELSLEADKGYITASNIGGEIKIREKKKGALGYKAPKTVILTIPDNTVFDEVDIESGAGKFKAEGIKTRELNLELGAGKADISSLNVSEKAEISGGAGQLVIDDSFFNTLDIDMGVGELKLTAEISEKCDVDMGVGNADVNLMGESSDYSVKLNKGLGNAKLDGKEMLDGETYGSSGAFIYINGGVGGININFLR